MKARKKRGRPALGLCQPPFRLQASDIALLAELIANDDVRAVLSTQSSLARLALRIGLDRVAQALRQRRGARDALWQLVQEHTPD